VKTPAWWTARSPRERAVVGWAGATVAVLLIFVLGWLPLERDRGRIAADLPALRASVAEMRVQAAEVQALRALPPRGAASVPLATLVAAGNLTQGLPGARVTMLDGKRARLTVDDASWTRLVEWLAATQATHGLAVAEAKVEALGSVGRVRGEFVLAAP
jgi:general secretion pathway protein M